MGCGLLKEIPRVGPGGVRGIFLWGDLRKLCSIGAVFKGVKQAGKAEGVYHVLKGLRHGQRTGGVMDS